MTEAEIRDEIASEEDFIKSINELVGRTEVYRVKIVAANVANQKINENLERIKMERQEEQRKISAIKQRIDDLNRAKTHATYHEYSIISALKKKENILKELSQLDNAQLNFDVQLAQSEKIKENLLQQKSKAPWIRAKRNASDELNYHQRQTAQIEAQVDGMEKLVTERTQMLAQHEQVPFKKLCITLAYYVTKHKPLERQINNELELHRTLKEKYELMKQQEYLATNDTITGEEAIDTEENNVLNSAAAIKTVRKNQSPKINGIFESPTMRNAELMEVELQPMDGATDGVQNGLASQEKQHEASIESAVQIQIVPQKTKSVANSESMMKTPDRMSIANQSLFRTPQSLKTPLRENIMLPPSAEKLKGGKEKQDQHNNALNNSFLNVANLSYHQNEDPLLAGAAINANNTQTDDGAFFSLFGDGKNDGAAVNGGGDAEQQGDEFLGLFGSDGINLTTHKDSSFNMGGFSFQMDGNMLKSGGKSGGKNPTNSTEIFSFNFDSLVQGTSSGNPKNNDSFPLGFNFN